MDEVTNFEGLSVNAIEIEVNESDDSAEPVSGNEDYCYPMPVQFGMMVIIWEFIKFLLRVIFRKIRSKLVGETTFDHVHDVCVVFICFVVGVAVVVVVVVVVVVAPVVL